MSLTTRFLSVVLLGGSLVSCGTLAAHAAPAAGPAVCDPGGQAPYYSFTDKSMVYVPADDGRIYGDSGITLSISKGTSKTIGGSVTGTVSAEAGVLFAKASASLAIQVSYSETSTTTFAGSWTVPKDQKTGWLEVGTNDAVTFRWERYHFVTPCKKVVEKSGTGTGPLKNPALRFRHS